MFVLTIILAADNEYISPSAMDLVQLSPGACSTNSTLIEYKPLNLLVQCTDGAEIYCGWPGKNTTLRIVASIVSFFFPAIAIWNICKPKKKAIMWTVKKEKQIVLFFIFAELP